MWTVSFINDTENPDIGTATAVFTDATTNKAVFIYSARLDSKNSAAAFIAAAKQGLAALQAQVATTTAIAAKIASALNG